MKRLQRFDDFFVRDESERLNDLHLGAAVSVAERPEERRADERILLERVQTVVGQRQAEGQGAGRGAGGPRSRGPRRS